MSSLTGALQGALDDVVRELEQQTFGQVDLSTFGDQISSSEQAIIAYLDAQLAMATGGKKRLLPGDSKLYGRRMLGKGIYFVVTPTPSDIQLRPEYHPGAKLLYLAGTEWGLYDLGPPAQRTNAL